MKVYVRSSEYDDIFVPDPFEQGYVENIISSIRNKIIDKYGRRFKKIHVDTDNINFDDNHIYADFIIYNNGIVKGKGCFEFSSYSDYFDESDFNSHLNRSIYEFVEGLI